MRMGRMASAVAAAAMGLGAAVPAQATFMVTLERAGVVNTTSTLAVSGVENFDARPLAGTNNFTSNFGGGTVSGTYSGVGTVRADQFGGAGGTGTYAIADSRVGASSYTIGNLAIAGTVGVNYFGLWISALDAGNTLTFFKNGAQVYSFGAADLIAAINATSDPGAYYGNPGGNFAGQNKGESYAFANFYDTDDTFDAVRLAETGTNAGYESDNHTVGRYVTTSGTTVGAVPEPATWGTTLLGFGLLGGAMRRRRPFAAEPA